ncbi:MAG TPA: MGMT family protein [Balneolales bacterium]|nr:MGMT family protein [Balneolales bacterium]
MSNSSSNKKNFFEKVYQVVAQIPYGRVTTYGTIAAYLGAKRSARMVGWALNATRDNPEYGHLPCHRVVNRNGEVTGERYFMGDIMCERLKQEGIVFIDENTVDLVKFIWDPSRDSNFKNESFD